MAVRDDTQTLQATFWYLQDTQLWRTTKPYFINVPKSALPDGQPATNEISVSVSGVPVKDMRNCVENLDIDRTGFTFFSHTFDTPEDSFQDYATARMSYIPEVEAWLCKVFGAETAHTLAFEVVKPIGISLSSD